MNSIQETPTFNILEHGKRKATLIHCFLHRMEMTIRPRMPTSIVAKNGEAYKVICEFPLPEQPMQLEVLISFQKHVYGNFAIIRAAHQKDTDLTFIFPEEN